MNERGAFVTGAILMGLAVTLGAFGAHGLKDYTDAAGLATWETAVRYQALHGLALLILSLAVNWFSVRSFNIVYFCFLFGVLVFSGSLYILVLSGIKWLGAITPIGGVLMIVGWVVTAASGNHRK